MPLERIIRNQKMIILNQSIAVMCSLVNIVLPTTNPVRMNKMVSAAY